MSAIIVFFLSPIGRWVGVAGISVLLLLSAYGKGQMDGRRAAYAKVERQQKRAIELAMKARAHLEEACKRNPKNCVPDEWFREEGDE